VSEKGKLIVISGPSGAGKSTVVFKAIKDRQDMCFSVSVTTRKPRPGEQDGREYFFITHDRFEEMVDNDELLEHAEYVSNSYGTPRSYVEEKLEQGLNVILDIEVQGAGQVNEKVPEGLKYSLSRPLLMSSGADLRAEAQIMPRLLRPVLQEPVRSTKRQTFTIT